MPPSPHVQRVRRHVDRPRPRPERAAARPRRTVLVVGLLLAVLAAMAGVGTTAVAAQGLIPAPATTIAADGRSATDGTRTLAAGETQGLAPGGSSVTVTGSGYDVNKGIYVAFCLVPPTNQPPTPCGGGVDMTGATGSSQWISSNAPAYGEGLATAYGPGGTFSLTIEVSPSISGSIDCRRVSCAIVSRNDHIRSSDRGQDIFLPVTFAANAPEPTPGESGPVIETTTTTAPEALPAPEVTLSADGRIATAGSMTLEVSQAADLDAAGMPVTVTGSGYDETKGIGVAFCVVGDEGALPGPCADGSENAADAVAWISSNPPEGGDAALPYQPGGAFSLTLAVTPTIAGVDCAATTCAIVTSNDSTRPLDRSQDVVIPVTFKAAPATTTSTTSTPELAAPPPDESSSTPIWLVVVGGLVLIAAGGGAIYAIVRKRGAVAP